MEQNSEEPVLAWEGASRMPIRIVEAGLKDQKMIRTSDLCQKVKTEWVIEVSEASLFDRGDLLIFIILLWCLPLPFRAGAYFSLSSFFFRITENSQNDARPSEISLSLESLSRLQTMGRSPQKEIQSGMKWSSRMIIQDSPGQRLTSGEIKSDHENPGICWK